MSTTITEQAVLAGVGDRSRRWWTRAACAGADVNLFFKPDKTESVGEAEKQRRIADAKALCRSCLVASECLAEALAVGDRYAIRGSYTAAERRHLGLTTPRELSGRNP